MSGRLSIGGLNVGTEVCWLVSKMIVVDGGG